MTSRSWTTYVIGRRRACHDIIALGLNKWRDDVGRGMPAWAFGNINGRTKSSMTCHQRTWAAHDQMMSGVECPYGPLAAHMVGRRRSSYGIIALGQHTPSDDVGHFMQSSPLGSTYGRLMLTSPLDNTHD